MSLGIKRDVEISPFGFCDYCEVSKKCCASVTANGPLLPAFVTGDDLREIENHLGKQAHSFARETVEPKTDERLTFIKTSPSSGCIFYKKDRCQIYDVRPFDCRIFPLDIFKIGRHFCWIIYNGFCEQPVNSKILRDYGDRLLQRYKPHLEEFAAEIDNSPPLLPFKILGKISTTNLAAI